MPYTEKNLRFLNHFSIKLFFNIEYKHPNSFKPPMFDNFEKFVK